VSKVTSSVGRMLSVGAVCLATALPVIAVSRKPVETKEATRCPGWLGGARPGSGCSFIGALRRPRRRVEGSKNQGLGEWIMTDAAIPVEEYQALQQQFNSVKFDARAAARVAKGAGMKYVVLTTKHIDGFCMFDSKLTNYDIMGRRSSGT